MKNHLIKYPSWLSIFMIMMLSCAMVFGCVQATGASSGEKTKEDTPEFIREGKTFVAKLIPRAKSTSVFIRFDVSNGDLADVTEMDFENAAHPEIDHKDFKSGLFKIFVTGMPKGGESDIVITSDFFSNSTEFWVFNEKLDSPWMNAEAENQPLGGLVQQMTIWVKDGGKYDSDGAENGQIVFVGGPKDSFWGYALGTLFIRFFGIFLVLSVLMIGMMFSGRIFQYLGKEKPVSQKAGEETPNALIDETDGEVGPDIASAIAVGLHLHLSSYRNQEYICLIKPEPTSWTQQGRERIMGVRHLVLNRMNRGSNS